MVDATTARSTSFATPEAGPPRIILLTICLDLALSPVWLFTMADLAEGVTYARLAFGIAQTLLLGWGLWRGSRVIWSIVLMLSTIGLLSTADFLFVEVQRPIVYSSSVFGANMVRLIVLFLPSVRAWVFRPRPKGGAA